MPEQFVNVVTPSGRTISVPAEESLRAGYRPQSPAEADEAARAREEAEAYGGLGNAIAGGFLGLLRTASGGLSDQYFTAVGGDSTAEDLSKLKEHQGAATAIGEVAGHVVGPGKLATAAGKAARAGATTAAKRVVAHGIEGAIDGGLYSTGQAISHSALSDDPLTTEQIAANIGLGAALGGGVGGLFGAGSEVAGAVRKRLASKSNPLLHAQGTEAKEMGKRLGGELRKADLDDSVWFDAQAHRANDEMIAMMQGRAPVDRAATQVDDLVRALARDADTDVMRVAERETQVLPRGAKADPNATNPGKRGAKPRAHVEPEPAPDQSAGPNINVESDRVARAEVAALKAEYRAARKRVANVLGDDLDVHWPALVRKKPAQMLRLAEDVDNYYKAANNVRALARREAVGTDDIVSRLAAGVPESEKALAKLKELNAPEALADVLGVDVGALPKLSGPGDVMLKMYAVSRGAETAAARRATVTMAEADSYKERVRQQLGGAIGGGIKAIAVGKVLGAPGLAMMSLASMAGKINARMAEAASLALEKGFKAGRRPGVLTASAILASTRFSSGEEGKERSVAMRRARELAEYAANPGRLDAAIADHTAPIRAHNLNLGFAVEDNLKRRAAYYHAVAPKSPVAASPVVQSRWQPSPGQEFELAVRIRAGENPLSLLEDFAENRLHPAAVETVEVLWPELYSQMQQALLERVTEMQADLPYAKRLQYSIMFKVPVEPTADPDFVKTLQDQYAARREMEQPPKSGGAPPAPPATKGQQLEAR